jgi:hypothetical protein
MENIKVEAQDGKLIITVTPGAPVPSASGKTMVVASTRGASPVTLPDGQEAMLNLNLYVPR